MDYKELVDALRDYADIEWFSGAENDLRNAADAIEQLASDINVIRKERDEWQRKYFELVGFSEQLEDAKPVAKGDENGKDRIN
ncbi:hypothetical protein [Treponema sp.]|uniref:hypothetical protein n=1 Tax=Treponema sp. TaxID=166 RepID=UPI00388DBABD